MEHSELKKLDRFFGDAMGWTPFQHVDPTFWRNANTYVGDQPKFKWAWGPDLVFPYVDELHNVRFLPMFREKKWIVAGWVPPPGINHWRSYHGTAPYPSNGYYIPVYRLALDEGVNPDIGNTRFAAAWLKDQDPTDHRRDKEKIYEAAREAERAEEKALERDGDFIEDCLPAFGSIPGTRGGVSFPSV